MSDYMASQMDSQIEGSQHTYAAMSDRIAMLERQSNQDDGTIIFQAVEISKHLDRIAELEAALAFYADPTRYHGPNQSLDSPDAWSEQVGLQAYRLDVTRDQGVIARNALKD